MLSLDGDALATGPVGTAEQGQERADVRTFTRLGGMSVPAGHAGTSHPLQVHVTDSYTGINVATNNGHLSISSRYSF